MKAWKKFFVSTLALGLSIGASVTASEEQPLVSLHGMASMTSRFMWRGIDYFSASPVMAGALVAQGNWGSAAGIMTAASFWGPLYVPFISHHMKFNDMIGLKVQIQNYRFTHKQAHDDWKRTSNNANTMEYGAELDVMMFKLMTYYTKNWLGSNSSAMYYNLAAMLPLIADQNIGVRVAIGRTQFGNENNVATVTPIPKAKTAGYNLPLGWKSYNDFEVDIMKNFKDQGMLLTFFYTNTDRKCNSKMTYCVETATNADGTFKSPSDGVFGVKLDKHF